MGKPILCLDFDGVCHSYVSGWQGAGVISDAPVEGLFEFLEQVKEHFTIMVFSSRSNQSGGLFAMREWIEKHYTEYAFQKHPELKGKFVSLYPEWLILVTEKPAAFLTIDDRAITFNGVWPGVQELLNFKPWYKR